MSMTTHWGSLPQEFLYKLVPGTVHVWRVPLDDSPERASCYRAYLSADELARADRCRIPHPQYQFVVTRGILRMLLSQYMKVHPAQLQFETQPQGKPVLKTASSFPIQFNVSHTRGMAFIAFTTQHAVGIDVEWIDRKIQDRDIAERYFSARESKYLASLSPQERTHQFFSYWTCKEAYLKMQGRGIAEGLAQCELTINSDQLQVGLTHVDQSGQGKDCSLHRITSDSGHVGAVAIACSSTKISYWNWEEKFLP
jgi:4'-phosphopantetheinyl transferase